MKFSAFVTAILILCLSSIAIGEHNDEIEVNTRNYGEQQEDPQLLSVQRQGGNGERRRQRNRGGDWPFERRKRRRMHDDRRPNIVLIMADDQDVELGSLDFMPKLRKHLRSQGTSFSNAFVTTPMCCPSRSSMLTGLYVHNHQVRTNNDNCSDHTWVQNHEPRTFAAYLQAAGYNTGYFGKYLNKYGGNHVPVGWNVWHGLIKNSRFYNYTLNVNGRREKHGFNYYRDYLPDLITNSSIDFFRESKLFHKKRPVLMVLGYPGPHGPEDAAPQYSQLFFNVTTHHTPAYDYAPNPDKQWILQITERMDGKQRRFTDLLMTKRLQTLQSIDEAVERLCLELEQLGELDNTYIVYTSDHGYHLGQFGLVKGKAFPFDVDIKVPFIVSGPGVPRNRVSERIALNIDIAPTLLDMGGVQRPKHMDGLSLLDALKKKAKWRDTFLVERGKMTSDRFERIKHTTTSSSSSSLPSSLPKSSIASLSPEQVRLGVECRKSKFALPCGPLQKHYCERKNGEHRVKRCPLPTDTELIRAKEMSRGIKECRCRNGAKFGWRLQRGLVESDVFEDADERWRQARFIRKHSDASLKRIQREHRFMTNMARLREDEHAVGRERRSADDDLDEMASEDLEEMDFIMEDISDEIETLKHVFNDSSHNETDQNTCHFASDKLELVDCKQLDAKKEWRHSRAALNEQIRRLQAQLFELKEIRKHLRRKRPLLNDDNNSDNNNNNEEKNNEDNNEENDSIDEVVSDTEMQELLDYEEAVEAITSQVPENAVQCRCRNNAQMRANHRRRLERVQRVRRRRRLRRQRERERKYLRKSMRKAKLKACEHIQVEDNNLNCFSHDNQHWRTPPFWTEGPFCACTNSNTNTYSCLRTVNSTHNFLYCEFVSGLITFYDLTVDPFQMRNIYLTLTSDELRNLHDDLDVLKDQGQRRRQRRRQQRIGGRRRARRILLNRTRGRF